MFRYTTYYNVLLSYIIVVIILFINSTCLPSVAGGVDVNGYMFL